MSAVYVDVEASGLHEASFPIEVAWGGSDLAVECFLIADDAWLADTAAWDPAAERLHGISKAALRAQGRPSAEVAARMNSAVGARVLLSTNAHHDARWLTALFRRAGIVAGFAMAYPDDALFEAAGGDADVVRRAGMLAMRSAPHVHRAAADVRHLIEKERWCRKLAAGGR